MFSAATIKESAIQRPAPDASVYIPFRFKSFQCVSNRFMLHKRKNLYQIRKPSKMIFRNFAPADSNCRDNKSKVQH